MSRSPANAPLARSVRRRSVWAAISNATRLPVLLAAVLGSILGTGLAHGQSFPSKTVRLIVPFAAGGPTDIAARLLADQLSLLDTFGYHKASTTTSEQLAGLIRSSIDHWRPIIELLGMKAGQ